MLLGVAAVSLLFFLKGSQDYETVSLEQFYEALKQNPNVYTSAHNAADNLELLNTALDDKSGLIEVDVGNSNGLYVVHTLGDFNALSKLQKKNRLSKQFWKKFSVLARA